MSSIGTGHSLPSHLSVSPVMDWYPAAEPHAVRAWPHLDDEVTGLAMLGSLMSLPNSKSPSRTVLMKAPWLTWNMASRFLAQLKFVSASTSVEASVSAKTAAMMLKMAWPPTTEATRGLTRSALPMTPGVSPPVSLSPPSEQWLEAKEDMLGPHG